ncbi:hypothetical protein COTS27_00632 [Spirochaetota bacterium]|nr:hypothetical protein COTS27_00632 [Spirochaetota bacterium]
MKKIIIIIYTTIILSTSQLLLAVDPNLINLANRAFNEELYEFAIKNYQKILATPQSYPPNILEQAQFYVSTSFYLTDQPALAIQSFQTFLSQFPKSQYKYEATHTLILTLQEQNQFEAAFSLGRKTLAETHAAFNPHYAPHNAKNSLTQSSSRLKKTHLTAQDVSFIVKTMSATTEALAIGTSDETRIEDFLTLIKDLRPTLEAALSHTPKPPPAYTSKEVAGDLLIIEGDLLTQLADHPEAANRYKTALKQSFTLVSKKTVRLALIKSYLEQRQYNLAEEILTETLYQTKDKAFQNELNFFLVHLAYLKGNYPKAIIGYKRYLDKTLQNQEPNSTTSSPSQSASELANITRVKEKYSVEALLHLALSYQQTEQSILALKTLSRVLTNPNLQSHHYRAHNLAYSLYELIEDDQALLETTEELLRLANNVGDRLTALEKSILFISRTGLAFDFVTNIHALIETRLAEYGNLQPAKNLSADLYLKAATYHYQNNQFEQSFNLFKAGYNLTHEPKLIFAAIEGLIEQKQFDRALTTALSLEQQLSSNRNSAPYLHDLIGFIYIKINDLTKARSYFELNTQQQDLSLKAHAYFYLGEIARLEEAYKKAIATYQQAETILTTATTSTRSNQTLPEVAAQPHTAPHPEKIAFQSLLFKIYFQIAKIHDITLPDPATAVRYYTAALDQAESLADYSNQNIIHIRLADLYLNKKEPAPIKAIDHLEKLTPQAAQTYYTGLLKLGSVYFNKNNYDKALAYYTRIINATEITQKPPPSQILEQAYNQRILIKVKLNAPREAYYYLGKMELNFPQSPLLAENYTRIADAFTVQKKWDTAIKIQLEAAAHASRISNIPWNISALFAAATTELIKNKTRKKNRNLAYTRFKDIIELSETHRLYTVIYLEACFEAAVLNADKGEHVLAGKQFRKILTHAPLIANQTPASRDFIVELQTQATENLERIDIFLAGSPYRALTHIPAIKEKIQNVSSPQLKAEGANLIIEKYLEKNRIEQALAYLKYAEKLWPLPKKTSINVMQALIKVKDYPNLHALALNYFLTDYFKDTQQHQEFLYYAAALSSAHLSKGRDSTRFKQKLKREFPTSTYLKNLN